MWKFRPESPLTGRAALLAASSYLETSQPKRAVELLERYSGKLTQPDGDLLRGKALEAAGEPARAAAAYQRVFYGFPLSDQASEAEPLLLRLEQSMGESFPPAMPAAMLERAAKLMRAGQTASAKKTYLAASGRVAGPEREVAQVRAGTGDYAYLHALKVSDPDADAERIYLMHAASRRVGTEPQAEEALRELNTKYPKSRWRMESLISWGNHFLLRNEPQQYEPLYRACVESFPDDPQAAYCHWKLVWSAWIQRAPNAAALMREHLKRFPESEKAAAANYFLGNYGVVLQRFPMSYYSVLARAKGFAVKDAAFQTLKLTPSAATRYHMDRAQILDAAGLPEWAEFELRSTDDEPYVVATALAEFAAKQGAYDRGLRYIKSLAKGYLNMPLEAAPDRFWRLAFPLPFRLELESSSRAQGLDPNLVAALIRQESEFDPKAVSRAKAYGLTQVMPATGRELSRRAGMRTFTPSMLFEPATNLKLGTMYLRSLLDQHAGRQPETLAAYNAGKRRVTEWLTWYNYREPAEFIETIPISETRNYVQIVLRNADLYRRIYQSGERSARVNRANDASQ